MTSSRFPGKVLADLGGRPMLAVMLQRVALASLVDTVVVATTRNPTDNPVADLAASLGVEVFRGDEHDVLGRYIGAADAVTAQNVMRLTADCPFIDPSLLDLAVKTFRSKDLDYLSNVVDRTYPDGLDVEVFKVAALRASHDESSDSHDREHVTPFIYKRPERFKIEALRHEADFSHVRWTVDVPEDLTRLRELLTVLPEGFCWQEVLAAATWRPDLLGIPDSLRGTRGG